MSSMGARLGNLGAVDIQKQLLVDSESQEQALLKNFDKLSIISAAV